MTTLLMTPSPPPPPPTKLTVAQYNQMIEHGILEEGAPIELLDGFLVRKDRSALGQDPMTVGLPHIWVVKKFAALDAKFHRHGCHIQTQQPISLPPTDEPEPDAAIILGTPDDYHDRKPSAADILAVIEVSDSSLRLDRTVKLAIYAKADIPHYVIVNLQENLIEVYTQPLSQSARYGHSETLSPKHFLLLPTATKPLKIPAKNLLP